MARRRHLHPGETSTPALDISSLIDVGFMLLFYFLVTSTLQPREADLGLELPTDTPTANPVQLDPVSIRVTVDGAIFMGDTQLEEPGGPSSVPQLFQEIQRYYDATQALGQRPVVIVAADDEANQQRFVDVLNALASAGITSITLTGFKDD